MAHRNVRIDLLHARQVLRATLPAPRRGDVPIALEEVVSAVSAALAGDEEQRGRTKLVTFAGERDFRVTAALGGQLAAFEQLIALGIPTAAVVRGSCAGGGLALAAFCNFIFAEREATFGGAMPGADEGLFDEAFGVLALKLGAGPALEMLLPGGHRSTVEAYRQGLVAAWTAGDGALEQLVGRWLETHLLPAPAERLRAANRAVRHVFHGELRAELPVLAQIQAGEPPASRAIVPPVPVALLSRTPAQGVRPVA